MSHLSKSDYTPEFWAEMQDNIEKKIKRAWTDSYIVEGIFEVLGLNDEERVQSQARHVGWSTNSFSKEQIGYLNPKASKACVPYGTKAYGLDVRFRTAGGNKEPVAPASGTRSMYSAPDAGHTMTDYASTIFIIDNPAYIDLLVKVGKYTMPKLPRGKDMVFLAMHPVFVESHPELVPYLDEARVRGELFDIADYREHMEISGEGIRPTVFWTGEVPMEIMEPLCAEKLSEAVSSIRGSVVRGFSDSKWGKVKDIHDCINLADAIMMQRNFVKFPSLGARKQLPTKGQWAKICEEHRFDFSHAKPNAEAKELVEKIELVAAAASLWRDWHVKTRVAICIDERDFPRTDFVFDAFCEIGSIHGMDSSIDALLSGVPAEDLLA